MTTFTSCSLIVFLTFFAASVYAGRGTNHDDVVTVIAEETESVQAPKRPLETVLLAVAQEVKTKRQEHKKKVQQSRSSQEQKMSKHTYTLKVLQSSSRRSPTKVTTSNSTVGLEELKQAELMELQHATILQHSRTTPHKVRKAIARYHAAAKQLDAAAHETPQEPKGAPQKQRRDNVLPDMVNTALQASRREVKELSEKLRRALGKQLIIVQSERDMKQKELHQKKSKVAFKERIAKSKAQELSRKLKNLRQDYQSFEKSSSSTPPPRPAPAHLPPDLVPPPGQHAHTNAANASPQPPSAKEVLNKAHRALHQDGQAAKPRIVAGKARRRLQIVQQMVQDTVKRAQKHRPTIRSDHVPNTTVTDTSRI